MWQGDADIRNNASVVFQRVILGILANFSLI